MYQINLFWQYVLFKLAKNVPFSHVENTPKATIGELKNVGNAPKLSKELKNYIIVGTYLSIIFFLCVAKDICTCYCISYKSEKTGASLSWKSLDGYWQKMLESRNEDKANNFQIFLGRKDERNSLDKAKRVWRWFYKWPHVIS